MSSYRVDVAEGHGRNVIWRDGHLRFTYDEAHAFRMDTYGKALKRAMVVNDDRPVNATYISGQPVQLLKE